MDSVQASLDRSVEEQLAQHDVRYTSGRRLVVAALEQADGPLSAAELQEAIESLPLSTIYRTLSVLEQAEILAPHHGTKGLTRYELAEWLRGHHHHLVCSVCGSVEDVSVGSSHEARIGEVVAEISDTASFTATDHVLEIEGRCARCAG